MTRHDDAMALIKWARWKASGSPLLDLKLNGSWVKMLNYFKEYLLGIQASSRTTKALESKRTLTDLSTEDLVAYLQSSKDVVSVYCWLNCPLHLTEMRTLHIKYVILRYAFWS